MTIPQASRFHSRLSRLIAILAVVVIGGQFAQSNARAQVAWDPSKVVGPTKCGECHKDTLAYWRNTTHFKSFTALTHSKKGRTIAKKMGLKRIKAGSLCLDCHFTTMMQGDKKTPVSGISCESCHGPGKGYIKRHSEFSGKKKQTESKAEQDKRWADSVAAGMNRPRDMYAWASNCYSCHIVPQEKLVNDGGHRAGSEFELVAWSQGEVRHNVWYNNGKDNPEASENQRRLMYVVGASIELETSLRAVGKASQKADYAITMAKRASRARKRIAKIAKALSEPEFGAIYQAAKRAKLKLNNNAELSAAADKISELTKKIVKTYDGSSFAAIDAMIPGPEKYKGKATK